MIELALLALLNRLTNWGLAPVIATRTVAADAAALHRLLADDANRQRLGGRLGARGQMTSRVRRSVCPRLLSVEIRRGRRRAWATWMLTPGRGTTDVDLAVQFESRGLATRLLLVFGGRRWLAARLEEVLATLGTTCARAAEDVVERRPCADEPRPVRSGDRAHTHLG